MTEYTLNVKKLKQFKEDFIRFIRFRLKILNNVLLTIWKFNFTKYCNFFSPATAYLIGRGRSKKFEPDYKLGRISRLISVISVRLVILYRVNPFNTVRSGTVNNFMLAYNWCQTVTVSFYSSVITVL